jgi:hypothetical protein
VLYESSDTVCVDTTVPCFASCQPNGLISMFPAALEWMCAVPSVPQDNRLSPDGRDKSGMGNSGWHPKANIAG